MAHASLSHLVMQRVRPARKAVRLARAVRPSRATELWYRRELDGFVAACRQAGKVIAEQLRPTWPHVKDEAVPGLSDLIGRIADRLVSRLSARVEETARRLAQKVLFDVDKRLSASVVESVGVNILPVLTAHGPINAAMSRKIRENEELIKSIPAQYLERVGDVISSGWATGARWEQMVDAIEHIGDVTQSRAALIARDQTSKLNAAFNEVRQRGLGIEEYSWSGALDARERQSHRDMEGSRQRWDRKPEVDGEPVHPGEAINCRCVALPIIQLELGRSASQHQEAA